ncbi:MAG: hypothetical protein KGD63_01470 [Candidatus Lokiarchaeota archaeon]|nr:hypothetical protein [Candidatus Lokiarchaeota archaeon]
MSYQNDDEQKRKKALRKGLERPAIPPPPGIPPPSIHPPMTPTPAQQPPQIPQSPTTFSIPPAQPSIASQDEIAALRRQVNELNNALLQKDQELRQLRGNVSNFQAQLQGYEGKITQLNQEKGTLEMKVQQIEQENMTLQQQIGPLQSQVSTLQQELAYKSKRIDELKEPKAVMSSSLGQGTQNQTPNYGAISSPPIETNQFGTKRKVCPNCAASGTAIKEIEDKTRIISYIPKQTYAKKNICTKCGFEF